jgi:hypothetical protein
MAGPVSPTRLMGCLPHGKSLFRAIPYLFAAMNLFEMTIHAVGGDPLQRWYLFPRSSRRSAIVFPLLINYRP